VKMEKWAKNGQMVQNCYPLSPRCFALMMRSRFSVFMISRQEYVFIYKFISREFLNLLFREIVNAFVPRDSSLIFP